jgi:prepilin-type processing-associated H-X9-DG protein
MKDVMMLAKGDESLDKADEEEGAFSRIDLLVVLALLAFLALMQFSALAHNRVNSNRFVCAENLRRLTTAWQMYSDDHRGRLVPNGFGNSNNWVNPVYLDAPLYVSPVQAITQALLYPYSRSVEIYKCPSDQRRLLSRFVESARSYSMNGWIGEGASGWVGEPTAPFQIQTHISLIRQPDQTFVFVEEHPDSINDGAFMVDVSRTGSSARLLDFPAAYHSQGANVSFADGSVQYRQWVDPRTVSFTRVPLPPVTQPNNPDVAWLQRVTTYRR